MSNEVLVTAIITTYNRQFSILNRAIRSVLSQTYHNMEIIIVDDNQFDSPYRLEIESGMIAYRNNTKIKYIKHNYNKGACSARNTGIKTSRGTFVAFLDDDDEWLEKKIGKQLDYFDDDRIGLVYCRAYIIREEKNENVITKNCKPKKKDDVFFELLKKNFIGSTSFPLIRREGFDKCGLFDEDFPAMQDYDMWVRIAVQYEIGMVDLPLVNYYDHSGERISNRRTTKTDGAERFIEKYREYIFGNKEVRAAKMLEMYLLFYSRKKYRSAFRWFLIGLGANPFSVKHILNYIYWGLKGIGHKLIAKSNKFNKEKVLYENTFALKSAMSKVIELREN